MEGPLASDLLDVVDATDAACDEMAKSSLNGCWPLCKLMSSDSHLCVADIGMLAGEATNVAVLRVSDSVEFTGVARKVHTVCK